MDSLIESEMQQIEAGNPPEDEEYNQVQFSELDETYRKETSVIEIDYEGDEASEIDENDEKTLLSHQLTFSNLVDR